MNKTPSTVTGTSCPTPDPALPSGLLTTGHWAPLHQALHPFLWVPASRQGCLKSADHPLSHPVQLKEVETGSSEHLFGLFDIHFIFPDFGAIPSDALDSFRALCSGLTAGSAGEAQWVVTGGSSLDQPFANKCPALSSVSWASYIVPPLRHVVMPQLRT